MPVDQSNTGPVIGLVSIDAKVTQTFTPSVSTVDSVQLALSPLIEGLFELTTITVNVRSGSISGPIIGTSNSLTLGAEAPVSSSVVTFTFTPSVAVSPGFTYVFEVVSSGGMGNVIGVGFVNSAYSGGSATIGGKATSTVNLYFSHVGTSAGGVPNPASNLAVIVAGSGELDLVWTNNGNLPTGFIIQRSTDNVTFTTLTTVGVVTTYRDTSVVALTTYYYKVIAINGNGNASASNVASGVTPGAKPNPATNLNGTAVGYTEIDLTWTNNGGSPTGFKIQRSTDNVSYSTIATTGVVTSYSATGLTSGTLYYFKVIATNAYGDAAASNVFDVSTGSLLPFNDSFDLYTSNTFPSSNWAQSDNSVGGHNTAIVVANESLDSSIANGASQAQAMQGTGNTQKQLLWAVNNSGMIVFPADVIVSMLVQGNDSYPNGNGPVARLTNPGQTFNGYNVQVGYHGGVALYAVVNGVFTSIGTPVQGSYNAAQTVFAVSLSVQGTAIKVKVKATTGANSGLYLNSSGTYVSDSTVYAISTTNGSISGSGGCGEYGDFAVIAMDDFAVTSAAGDITAPTVSLTSPTQGNSYNQTVTLTATASDNFGGSGMNNVELWVDATVASGDLVNGTGALIANVNAPGPYTTTCSTLSNGTHTAVARAFDVAGNHAISASISFTITGSTVPVLPTFGKSLPNLTIAAETYGGFVMDADSTYILQYVDWVADALATLRALKANCIFSYYINFAQIYQTLWLDWLNYADANSLDRQEAFYHGINTIAFTASPNGTSPAASFHQLFSSTNFTDKLTNPFVDVAPPFTGTLGDIVYVGHAEKTRSMTFINLTAASGGWTAVLEVCTAVDVNGHPTTWTAITPVTDGTAGFTATGTQTYDFDPLTSEVACIIAGQPGGALDNGINGFVAAASAYRFFYRRWRVTHAGTPPTATGIRSRDYTGAGFAQGSQTGPTIGNTLVYDYTLDAANGSKGFLTAAQYASRAAGKDAYFSYEGMAPHGYGFGRWATNPADANFVAWAKDYCGRLITSLQGQGYDPDAIDVDNSSGTINFSGGATGTNIKESVVNYLANYSTLCGSVWKVLGTNHGSQRFLNANIGKAALLNGNTNANNAIIFVTYSPSVTYEGVLLPFSDYYSNLTTFQQGAQAVAAATSPAAIQTIDGAVVGPTSIYGNDATSEWKTLIDPISGYNLLAYYHQLMTAGCVLSFFGQQATNASFAYHWSQACLYDLGQPTSASTQLDSRADPSDSTKTAVTFSRPFANGLSVYRPMSYGNSSAGVWGAGAITLALGGTYYLLNIPIVITGTAAGVSGRVRLTLAFSLGNLASGNPTDNITTGQNGIVAFVHGTTEANGTWTMNVIDGTHVDLVGTTYSHAFVAPTPGSGLVGGSGSGGLLIWKSQTPQTVVTLTNGNGAIFFNSPS